MDRARLLRVYGAFSLAVFFGGSVKSQQPRSRGGESAYHVQNADDNVQVASHFINRGCRSRQKNLNIGKPRHKPILGHIGRQRRSNIGSRKGPRTRRLRGRAQRTAEIVCTYEHHHIYLGALYDERRWRLHPQRNNPADADVYSYLRCLVF